MTGVNRDNTALVDQHDLLKPPGTLFVIPAFHACLFLACLSPEIFISPVLISWFSTNSQKVSGRISRANNFPPAAETVGKSRIDKYRH